MTKSYKGVISDSNLLNLAWHRIEHLLEKQDNGCWLLLATRSKVENYYPLITVHGFADAAHRISYRYHKGEVPDGQLVRHTCDTPRCCNPDHLISGTIADNMRDKVERDRCQHMIGEQANRAKIKDADIPIIYASDEHRDVLAERYGVWPSMITRIRMAQHSLTKHLPARRFNDSEHFTEARKRAISDGHKRRTEPRRTPAPYQCPNQQGERHHMSKLTEQDALAIFHSTEDKRVLATRYGVHERSIRDVRAGRHWATRSIA